MSKIGGYTQNSRTWPNQLEPYLGAALVFMVAFTLLGPSIYASFVGTEGIALVEHRFGPFWSKPRVLLFDDAESMRLDTIRVYGNGYSGTNVQFRWFDSNGICIFVIETVVSETYIDRSEFDIDAARRHDYRNLIHFGLAAQSAWGELFEEEEDDDSVHVFRDDRHSLAATIQRLEQELAQRPTQHEVATLQRELQSLKEKQASQSGSAGAGREDRP
jgi:hypothetical protein